MDSNFSCVKLVNTENIIYFVFGALAVLIGNRRQENGKADYNRIKANYEVLLNRTTFSSFSIFWFKDVEDFVVNMEADRRFYKMEASLMF